MNSAKRKSQGHRLTAHTPATSHCDFIETVKAIDMFPNRIFFQMRQLAGEYF